MRGKLLQPTGSAECDLLSFAINISTCDTSPMLDAAQNASRDPRPKNRVTLIDAHKSRNEHLHSSARSSFIRNKPTQSQSRSIDRDTQQTNQNRTNPRSHSRTTKHHPRLDDPARESMRRRIVFPRHVLSDHSVLHVEKENRPDRNPPLQASASEQLSDAGGARFPAVRGTSGRGVEIRHCGEAAHSPPEKSRKQETALRQQPEPLRTKRKKLKRRNSIFALPTGSHFDGLVRSGLIAKQMALDEKRRRRAIR